MRHLPVAPYIQSLRPYVPGKPIEELRRERGLTGEILKLASNENPLGGSPKALAAAHAAFQEAHFYPDGAAWSFRERIAQFTGVGIDEVVTGNGSNELIELIIRAFSCPGDQAVVSQYAFVMYSVCLQTHGVETIHVPARAPLTHDLLAMADAVTPKTRTVWIANPNNPTGTYNGREELLAFFERLKARGMSPLVVVDEAYLEYASAEDYPNSLEMRDAYRHMITLRTFSKCYGLAAFRLGYGIAHPEVIDVLHRIRAPFNVGRIAQAAGIGALDDQEFVARSVAANATGMAQVHKLLGALDVEVVPSQTNFVLVKLPFPAAEVFDKMLDHGVIIRPLTGFGIPDAVRITIGTEAQNARMAEALGAVLSALSERA